ncbi:MAG TPA: DUF4012 domain-containing protein [Ktedonobacteraceae bacterium]|nr:DUF4012 domain-containing protein [Ktedonobacteraceae bacterium]
MSGVQTEISPADTHTQDMASWKEGDISRASKKAKRRYFLYKAAIKAYKDAIDHVPTGDVVDTIARRYDLSVEMIEQLAKRCAMLHEDGAPWGFRALAPGAWDHIEGDPEKEVRPTASVGARADDEGLGGPLWSPADEDGIGSTRGEQEEQDAGDHKGPPRPASAALAPTGGEEALWSRKYARITSKKMTVFQRSIRRRWVLRGAMKRKRRGLRIVVSIVVAASTLLAVLIPIGAGIVAYGAYTSIRGMALDGVDHLMNVKSLLAVAKSDPAAVLNVQQLQRAGAELSSGEGDFLQLQSLINRPEVQNAILQFAPSYSGKLGMAERLIQVGIDASKMGGELINVAMLGATILHGSPLETGSTKPLITTADISNIEGALAHALYYIGDIRAQMSQVSLEQLPISDAQKKQLGSVLTLLPTAQNAIEQGQGLIGIVAWLLGVGHERRFLLQTLDRAELRPSGGFTGQYGILDIKDGRMAPLSLRDVTELDYAGNGVELGRSAPPEYRSWMNFGFWGLRDANLSGDYPTSARLGMQVFQDEGGGPVDGDISFTPVVIEHILSIIGPMRVPQYNETITAQNLEERLHYYQQNSSAIALQKQKSGTSNAATRKTFTTLLGKILLDRLRHLPVKTLIKVAQGAVKDISSRDLELYFADPQAEGWLLSHGYSGAMDTFTKQDGFMVVQANISISKASQYVHTTEQDNIVLDAQGGATHNLTITLDYKQSGPVYGYSTYADYIRVYAPANAQFISGDGFDTGTALCIPASPGSSTGNGDAPSSGCSQFGNSFFSSARYCPNGDYSLGQKGYIPGKGFTNWPIDSLGAPTEMSSDLPGRAMWGGLTVTPKNCISTISLAWYVPGAVKHVVGQSQYAVLVQKQGGYVPTVQISIDTSALAGVKPYNFSGDLIADQLFVLPMVKKAK